MTREEEIIETAEKRTLEIFGELDDFQDRTDGFIEGAKWADKTMIEKVCEWLNMNIIDYITEGSREGISLENQKQLVDDFRKAMEE